MKGIGGWVCLCVSSNRLHPWWVQYPVYLCGAAFSTRPPDPRSCISSYCLETERSPFRLRCHFQL